MVLTVDECAKLLKVHKNTIYNWINEGRLKTLPRRKGGKILIIESSILGTGDEAWKEQ